MRAHWTSALLALIVAAGLWDLLCAFAPLGWFPEFRAAWTTLLIGWCLFDLRSQPPRRHVLPFLLSLSFAQAATAHALLMLTWSHHPTDWWLWLSSLLGHFLAWMTFARSCIAPPGPLLLPSVAFLLLLLVDIQTGVSVFGTHGPIAAFRVVTEVVQVASGVAIVVAMRRLAGGL